MSEVLLLEDIKQLEAMKPAVQEEIDTHKLSFRSGDSKSGGFDEIVIYDCEGDGCYATFLFRLPDRIEGMDFLSEREMRYINTITFSVNILRLYASVNNEHTRWLIEKGEKYK
jgi:hypothetical protein